jgi:hypothetical protein
MPGEVQRIEFGRRDARGVEPELGHRGVEDLPAQNVQPLERPPPAAHLLHGRLLEPAPRIGEVARIDVRLAVAGQERPGLARQAAIPVDHRAEGVEHQRTHSVQRHVANSSNRFSSVT